MKKRIGVIEPKNQRIHSVAEVCLIFYLLMKSVTGVEKKKNDQNVQGKV